MPAQLTATDSAHLRRALQLAQGGRGRVSPNPLVGAVLARGPDVIGEGHHAELGGLHAERAALEDCRRRGQDPAGATLYVTLEPCAHHGRQPPCVEAILESAVGRVVIASDDPSEKAAGRGPGILRDGGVEVSIAAGDEATAARLLNQPFRKHARTGMPHVVLKLAMSLDGRTTTAADDSPWISSPESRALVHRWRAESDAIAVGIGTALADDPLLTARVDGNPRQPRRIVFDSAARLPLKSRLLESLDVSPVVIVCSDHAERARIEALRSAGAEVLVASGSDRGDRIRSALSELGRRDITSLLLEGGRILADAFAAADQLDEARIFLAPVLLGATDEGAERAGPVAAGDPPTPAVAEASSGAGLPTPPHPRRTALHTSREAIGDDVLITARFKEW